MLSAFTMECFFHFFSFLSFKKNLWKYFSIQNFFFAYIFPWEFYPEERKFRKQQLLFILFFVLKVFIYFKLHSSHDFFFTLLELRQKICVPVLFFCAIFIPTIFCTACIWDRNIILLMLVGENNLNIIHDAIS